MNKKIFHLLRTTALLAALSLFALLAFESFHAGHEDHCYEEDCPVCLVLQIIHNNNKISEPAPLTSIEFSTFSYINLFIISALLLAPATLVKQKVKLVI
ncbi:hypothetical protein [Treponema bryantii]|uniref:hypothetical protein n=1 Tax=Treponema bryantii TaxID=163 RepID=UPI0003B36A7D|nr:hypothetical protein [Treponema bryantii]